MPKLKLLLSQSWIQTNSGKKLFVTIDVSLDNFSTKLKASQNCLSETKKINVLRNTVVVNNSLKHILAKPTE
jgi:hypothetical protein